MSDSTKQAITGFKVATFQVKKTKDSEVIKLVLEADTESIGVGEFEVGDVLKALLVHQTGDTDVGFSLFMKK